MKGGNASPTWTGVRGYRREAAGGAQVTLCRVTFVGVDDRVRRSLETLPMLLFGDDLRRTSCSSFSSVKSPACTSKESNLDPRSQDEQNGDYKIPGIANWPPSGGNLTTKNAVVGLKNDLVVCTLPFEIRPKAVAPSLKKNTGNRKGESLLEDPNGRRKQTTLAKTARISSDQQLHPATKTSPRTRSSRDADVKYTDPVANCPLDFQQRLSELSSMQNETVRWERQQTRPKRKQAAT